MKRIRDYFGKLKGNSAVCIAAHPFWAIPYMFYTYYISLYLEEKGISSGQLGTLMVIGTVAATVFSFLSAPIVDKLGRRNATLIFDLLSSAVPPLIYFLSSNFFAAMLAMILFNANRLMSVAYYLVMTEDAEDEGKIVAFNLFNAITVIAGLLLPIGGLIVGRFGLVKAENAFLLISFTVMTVMILIRHRLLKETAVGERVREKARAEKTGFLPLLKSLWKPYRDAIRFLLENRVARAVMLANVFYCVYMNLGTNYSLYFVPYFADRLGMDTMQSSVLGSVYYGGMLAAMIFINPLFGRGSIIRGIVISCGVSLAGMAMMVGIPGGMFVPAIMATLVLAVGYGMLKSTADGAMAVYSESEFRSGIYSTANLLSSGIGVIVTAVCAALYARFAGWLYILCGIMILMVMFFALRVRGLEREESTQKE